MALDARPRCGRGLAGAIVFIDDHARHTHIATELAEILHRGADIVGHIEGLKVIASHHDDLLTHVSCDGQSKATADDIAQLQADGYLGELITELRDTTGAEARVAQDALALLTGLLAERQAAGAAP